MGEWVDKRRNYKCTRIFPGFEGIGEKQNKNLNLYRRVFIFLDSFWEAFCPSYLSILTLVIHFHPGETKWQTVLFQPQISPILKTYWNSRAADGGNILRVKGLTCSDNIDFLYVANGMHPHWPQAGTGEAGPLFILASIRGPKDFACTISARK